MDIQVNDSGTWKSLTDRTIASLLAMDGTAQAPGHVISSRGPEQHGETYVDYRLDPRNLQLVFGIEGANRTALETKRLEVIRLLSWMRGQFDLRFTTDGDLTRQITVCAQGDPTGAMDAIFRGFQKMGVQLHATDPTFYDPTVGVETFDLGAAAGAGFTVPTEVPTAIGGSTIDQTHNVAYAGSAPTSPTIRITGPITDCVITNVTTSKKLDFTGATIAAGNYYDIDTRYAYQTVEDQASVNKIANLTDDSDLGTFALVPWPTATGGVNAIRVTGDAVNSNTLVTLTYYLRYLGI